MQTIKLTKTEKAALTGLVHGVDSGLQSNHFFNACNGLYRKGFISFEYNDRGGRFAKPTESGKKIIGL